MEGERRKNYKKGNVQRRKIKLNDDRKMKKKLLKENGRNRSGKRKKMRKMNCL